MRERINQRWIMENLSQSQRIQISSNEFDVFAPIPDNFGFTVGSEYSAPFDSQSLSQGFQRALALGGIAPKFGIRTKKMYTNPEPMEFSLELTFTAYYDAIEEVLMPIIRLLIMTLGRTIATQYIKDQFGQAIDLIGENLDKVGDIVSSALSEDNEGGFDIRDRSNFDNDLFNLPPENESRVDAFLNMVGIIRSPGSVTVKVGNVLNWEKVFITSCAPEFSNVLDYRGVPMYGKVTLNLTPESYPIAEEMAEVFSNGNVSVDLSGGNARLRNLRR